MKRLAQTLASVAIATSTVMAPTPSHAERTAKDLPVLTVFVDPPTGFVFLRLPGRWHFVGKLSDADMARLPQGIVTSLLEGDDGAVGSGATRVTEAR